MFKKRILVSRIGLEEFEKAATKKDDHIVNHLKGRRCSVRIVVIRGSRSIAEPWAATRAWGPAVFARRPPRRKPSDGTSFLVVEGDPPTLRPIRETGHFPFLARRPIHPTSFVVALPSSHPGAGHMDGRYRPSSRLPGSPRSKRCEVPFHEGCIAS